MLGFTRNKMTMVDPARALPGRSTAMAVRNRHAVLGTPLRPPFPDGFEQVIVAMGCFWGAEKAFWSLSGVYTTAVGYAGGMTPNPTYEEVCCGRTGHTEAVLVVFDPARTSTEAILRVFWEGHDPTQGMRQGNDVGTQYRSAIYGAPSSSARSRRPRAIASARSCRRPATARSPPRSHRRASSTTPRTTTSSTCTRTRWATAVSAEPASAAPSAWQHHRRPSGPADPGSGQGWARHGAPEPRDSFGGRALALRWTARALRRPVRAWCRAGASAQMSHLAPSPGLVVTCRSR